MPISTVAGDQNDFNTAVDEINAAGAGSINIINSFNVVDPNATTAVVLLDLMGHTLGVTGFGGPDGNISVYGDGSDSIIDLTGTNSFGALSGTTSVIAFDGNDALGSGDTVTLTSETFQALNDVSVAKDIALAGQGATFDTAGYTMAISGVISGGAAAPLFVGGGGTLQVSGVNTYTGATTINAGTLALEDGGSIADSSVVNVASGATFDVSSAFGTPSVMGLSGAGDVTLGGKGLTLTGDGSNTFAGVISGNGSLTEDSEDGTGTQILTGANTYTGQTTVEAGTLLVDGSTAAASTVQVDSGATLGGNGDGSTTGLINGSVNVAGTISAGDGIGDIGTLTTRGLALTTGSTFIEDGTSTSNADLINVGGNAPVSITGSTLVLDFGSNFASSNGDVITLIDGSGVTGTFNGLAEGATIEAGSRTFKISYAGGAEGVVQDNVTLTDVTQAPPPPPTPPGGGTTPTGPTPGADNLTGTAGNDSIALLAGNDRYNGLAGNDLIYGNQGNDLVYGNMGDDRIFGGMDNDTAYGGQGQDIIYGNHGNDIVYGNKGNDALFGGQGNDTVYGGQGDDVLFGNKGDDVLVGGLGSDTFGFNAGDTDFKSGVSTGDTIADFVTGTDKIDFTQGPAATASNFASGNVSGGSFAQLQAAAQTLITGGDAYVFETNGTDGYLFTSAGGPAGSIEDAVKLTGANTAGSVKATDIAHGAAVA